MIANKSELSIEDMPTAVRVIAGKLDASDWTLYLAKGKTHKGCGYYLHGFKGSARINVRMYIYGWGVMFHTAYGSRMQSQINKRGFIAGDKLLESFKCYW